MSGLFASWQPRYAAFGIPTFPVRFDGADKRPGIRGWQHVGTAGSEQLALKFPEVDALGFVLGSRSGISVLDIDTTCARARDAAFDRHGEPAIVVRSTSGHWQGWYRHNGERRHVRPWGPARPIDVLGNGFVVGPPSRGPRGRYQFAKGGLEDVPRLSPLRGLDLEQRWTEVVPQGQRDNWLFRRLLREVRACDDFDTLLDVARTLNMNCMPPLSDVQVVSKAKQAWKYEIEGRNWAGRRPRASTDRDEILALSSNPNAAMLLNLLRVSHPDPDAVFAIDHVQTAKLLGWNRKRMPPSIDFLLEGGWLNRVHCGGRGEPHLYKVSQLPAAHVPKGDTI